MRWWERASVVRHVQQCAWPASTAPPAAVSAFTDAGAPPATLPRSAAVTLRPRPARHRTAADRRPRDARGYRPALDGFRGLAVLLVLVGHLGVARVASAGTVGVTLFFVLSGFLITLLLLDEHDRHGGVHVGHFFARRALRLLPALAVVLAAVGVWSAVAGDVVAPVRLPALQVANLAAASGADLGVLDHTWSLSLEMQFYLVWPLVLIAAWRRHPDLAVVAASVGFAGSLLTGAVLVPASGTAPGWERVVFGPDTRSYALFLGCLVALVVHQLPRERWLPAAVVPLLLVVPAVASLTGLRSATFTSFVLPLTALAGALLVATLHRATGGGLERAWGWGPLTYLGRVSYGLYLWHIPVYVALQPVVIELSTPAGAALRISLSVAVAALSYHLLEQPLLALKRRFRRAPRLVPGVAPA